jgi:hypothetical protein
MDPESMRSSGWLQTDTRESVRSLRSLEHCVGEEIFVGVRHIQKRRPRNPVGDEERGTTDERYHDVTCQLENIFYQKVSCARLPYLSYLQATQGAEDVLIPFDYHYSDYLNLWAEVLRKHWKITRIKASDGREFMAGPLVDYLFDDYDVRVPQDAETGAAYCIRKPFFAGFGCEFDEERLVITGDIERLITGYDRLW